MHAFQKIATNFKFEDKKRMNSSKEYVRRAIRYMTSLKTSTFFSFKAFPKTDNILYCFFSCYKEKDTVSSKKTC